MAHHCQRRQLQFSRQSTRRSWSSPAQLHRVLWPVIQCIHPHSGAYSYTVHTSAQWSLQLYGAYIRTVERIQSLTALELSATPTRQMCRLPLPEHFGIITKIFKNCDRAWWSLVRCDCFDGVVRKWTDAVSYDKKAENHLQNYPSKSMRADCCWQTSRTKDSPPSNHSAKSLHVRRENC